MSIYKNETVIALFLISDSDGAPLPGDAENITAQVTIDTGTAVPTNDTNPTELDPVAHPGVVYFNMTALEMSGCVVTVTPQSTTDGVKFSPASQVFYLTDRPAAPDDQMDLIDELNENALAAIADAVVGAIPEDPVDPTTLVDQITQLTSLIQEANLTIARATGIAHALGSSVVAPMASTQLLAVGTGIVVMGSSQYKGMTGTITGVIRDSEYVIRLTTGKTVAVPAHDVRAR